MPGVPDVRTRRREQTRAEIVAAAWQIADRDGIAGVSLKDIADAVGMRAPSLYTYYSGKAAIYDEMFAEGYLALQAAMAEVPIDRGDPVGSLAGAMAAFVDFCAASVPRYQLLFTRAVPGWQPSPEAYAASVAAYEWMVGRFAGLGIEAPDELDLFTALTSGLASQQLANDPGGERWRRLNRPAAEMFLAHVRSR